MRTHYLLPSLCVIASALLGATTVSRGAPALAKTATTHERFSERQVTRHKLEYLLSLPEGYAADKTKRWPLLLFLHGAGERGTELEKVTVHGPPKMIKEGRALPFIVVSPQCPAGEIWNDAVLIGLLNKLEKTLRVDQHKVYLTGLSMGGYGTWSLATRYPDRFAAVAPICGGGERIRLLLLSPEQKKALGTLGIWAFHGAKDSVVPLEESERMIRAVKAAGNSGAQLTIYPEADHNSWTQAYNEPDFFPWLLRHSR